MKILAVTACPVGIAHTYMAAENLQKAGEEMGIDMKVETQGSIGVENELTDKEIEEADGIIIASGKEVSRERFIGKKLLVVNVQDGIRKPKELIEKIQKNEKIEEEDVIIIASGKEVSRERIIGKKLLFVNVQNEIRKPKELIKKIQKNEVTVYRSETKTVNQTEKPKKQNENYFYRHLMNGVSYMIPFIVVGGLLIAISLTLGGEQTPGGIVIPESSIWSTIEVIGAASFSFMVPIVAGFIPYSIADRLGLASGIIGGFIAVNGSFYGTEADAGFIGGIIAGFLAGYVVLALIKIRVPDAVQPFMPIFFIPIFGTLIVSLLFIFVIGAPVSAIFEALTNWLEGMQGTSSILLALLLGAMIAVDMGGPFNKVAFLFGSAMIVEGNYGIMGPIAVAICIPPLGMGLAIFLNKRKYQPAEREAGKASFTMW